VDSDTGVSLVTSIRVGRPLRCESTRLTGYSTETADTVRKSIRTPTAGAIPAQPVN